MAAELHPAVEYQSVIPDSHTENYSDRLLVLKPSSLKEDYRHEEFQYFFAESGFGCDPEKLGTKVFGRFLIDGEESAFRRYDFSEIFIQKQGVTVLCVRNPIEREVDNVIS